MTRRFYRPFESTSSISHWELREDGLVWRVYHHTDTPDAESSLSPDDLLDDVAQGYLVEVQP